MEEVAAGINGERSIVGNDDSMRGNMIFGFGGPALLNLVPMR